MAMHSKQQQGGSRFSAAALFLALTAAGASVVPATAWAGPPGLPLLAMAYARTHRLAPAASGAGAGKVVEFQPGLRIDFAALTVEADAVVVLRQGPLELLACSVGTREHESILAVRNRPLHLFQALGLIGLEPGSPVRYDAQQQAIPASGSPVAIHIRYPDAGRSHTVPATEWLVEPGTAEPPVGLRWVLAGSFGLDDGRFAADLEGTVVCLVDFAAALVAVDAAHTASNDELWLAARTDHIPAVGTRCTLIFTAAAASAGEAPASAKPRPPAGGPAG